jgi:replication factor C subunit 4
MIINDKEQLYYEKYRPQRIQDMILPDDVKTKLQHQVDTKNLSNMLFSSFTPGTGKTSCVNAIAKESGLETLFLNASLNNGIDSVRTTIQNFASYKSFDDNHKIVIMDECLEENEEICLVENDKIIYKKLKDFEIGKSYNCKSLNLENGLIEDDTCEIISDKFDDVYEVELEDGRKILVTDNHPFILNDLSQKSIKDGLKIGDDIKCEIL